jgi:Protein of unknown function (DUF3575)
MPCRVQRDHSKEPTVMKSKLTSAAIAAAIIACSSAAPAQQKAPRDKANAAHEQVRKPTRTKARKGGEKAKGAEKAAKDKGNEKCKCPDSLSDGTDNDVDETGEATEGAQEDGAANPQIENERRAHEKREREAKDRASAKEAGEAVGRATTSAATAFIQTGQDVTRALDQPGKYNAVAASWNPLGLIIGGRVSFNVEYAPVAHHVIILSPHFVRTSEDLSANSEVVFTNRFTGAGGELGYRYYTGHRGMNGIFIGPSFVGGVYNARLAGGDMPFTNLGLAVDVGIQHIFRDHLVLGAGAGVEYLHVSKNFGDVAIGPSTIASSGVKPRLLAQAGYAF